MSLRCYLVSVQSCLDNPLKFQPTIPCPWKLFQLIKNIFFYQTGSGSSVTMVSSLCITADMIGKHTYQGGFIYSAVTFADKLITGIVVAIIEAM